MQIKEVYVSEEKKNSQSVNGGKQVQTGQKENALVATVGFPQWTVYWNTSCL